MTTTKIKRERVARKIGLPSPDAGKIEHDIVYLLNSQNKFDKIDIALFEQEDLFTKQAQKAYSHIE